MLFTVIGLALAVGKHGDGIETLTIDIFRVANQRRYPARGCANRLERFVHLGLQPGLEQQVFGRITTDRKFGKYDEVGAVSIPCRLDGRQNHGRVASDVADGDVQLRDRDFDSIRHKRCRAPFSQAVSSSRCPIQPANARS